ncbi:DUF2125 domain-containing protein [Roseovarius sp. S4756]|uniref:DUF2125 domain-containing protein n=1 Tax=Roseovarius maritimus TaxID=3342637 RepID=UPI003729C572
MTAAMALMVTGSAAMADVTPADVWADWQDYLTGFGFAVTADEAQTASGLELTNIVLTQTLPDEGGETTITVPQIALNDNGTGTVRIVYPGEMPITIAADAPEAYTLELLYRTEGMDSVVSGNATRMSYDYTADNIGMTMGSLTAEGEAVDLGDIRFDMRDVVGQTVMMLEDGRAAEQTVRSGPATYTVNFADPEGGAVALSGEFETLEMMGNVIIPDAVDMNDMAAALEAGFAMDGGYVFGPGNSRFEFTDEGDVTTGSSSSQGGQLTIRMDKTGLAYGGTTKGTAVEAMVPQMPFALSMEMDESAFDLLVPLAEGQEPQDFGLTFLLGGLTLGDNVWGLFDPEGVLPRDPATVALDLDGEASVFVNIMDAAAMAELDSDDAAVPAELNALTLNRLLISLAGAELTGQGNVTFDNSDTVSYGGQPKPVGNLSFVLTGANTLMDKLISMGLLEQDQAMGARMMLGMAAVPGEGEDVLKSDIEFTEDGGIVANGQRLK